VVAWLGACSLNTKPEQPSVMASTGITKSADGMRVSVLARSQNAADDIERTADTIAAQTRDPQVRRNAIQWKLVSTAELQTAALARDPVVLGACPALSTFNITQQLDVFWHP
jgi:hypothetical protein